MYLREKNKIRGRGGESYSDNLGKLFEEPKTLLLVILELPAAVRLFTFIVMDFSSILILFWNANYVESLVMFDCVQYL